jgi:membrane protease YdiL (CAAX protease family)
MCNSVHIFMSKSHKTEITLNLFDLGLFLFVFIIPILLLVLIVVINPEYLGGTSEKVFTFVTIGCLFIAIKKRYSLNRLGIHIKNWKSFKTSISEDFKQYFQYFITTLSIAVFIILIGYKKATHLPIDWTYFIWYLLLAIPIQIFIFRAVLLNLLKDIWNNDYFIIIVGAIPYAFAHIIYKDLIFVSLAFCFGLVLNYLYYKRPNFVLMYLFHSIIGLIVVLGT